MKGQRLFVRPIEAADRDAIGAFLTAHSPDSAVPTLGLLGKLVGNLAAVLAMTDDGHALRIDGLVVAPELRRKRVGRVMIDELVQLAAKMERSSLLVQHVDSAARGFFIRVGFIAEGDRLVRQVSGSDNSSTKGNLRRAE